MPTDEISPDDSAADPTPADPIAAALIGLLVDRGPLTDEQMAAGLVEAGLASVDEAALLVDELLDSDGFQHVAYLDGDRFAYLPTLLAGRMFTHRLTAVEVAHDLVTVTPDLEPLSMLIGADPFGHLTDGREVVEVLMGIDDDAFEERGVAPADVTGDAWLLPTGLLAELGAGVGDLVAFGVTSTGWQVVKVADADVVEIPADLAERLVALLPDDSPAMSGSVIWTLCSDDPQLFAVPLPPLADVLDSAGLIWQGDWIAPAGFDFDGWRLAGMIDRISTQYGLDADQAMAVLLGTAVLQSGPEGVDPAELTNALAGLVDPGVAEAVLSECIGAERVDAPALAEAAQVLEGLARRTSRVALRWMRGKALERMGAVAPAEQVLGEAESLDPAWSPVLFDLARYASDRGDAARGLSLLERAGAASDDQLVALLERFRPNDDELGRNDPCWCGSGRKLKQCHRGPAPRSLAERATWLYQKALWFLQDGPWRGDLVDLAYLRSADWDEEHAVLRAMADPIVGDALLFEGGAFEEFVAERGFLLPADELALAQEWLLVKRSVFEIDDVRAGQGMTVLDVRTGDRHEVSDRVVSRVLMPGDLICARIVPAGQTRQGFGGIEPVDPAQRDELVALLNAGPGPFEVVGFLSARFARPHIDDAAPKPELDPK